MRDADDDGASVGEQIIDAIGDGNAGGIRAEVVIVDQTRGKIPAGTGILEGADQFPLLGVDADDGMAATLESLSQIAEVEELIVPIRGVVGGEFLVIDTQRIAHLMEQAGDGVGADADAEVGEREGNLGRRSTGPL